VAQVAAGFLMPQGWVSQVIDEGVLWVESSYRQLQEVKFRFRPQSSYTLGVDFNDVYSSKRLRAGD
jgi:hypothetical protein